MAERGTEPDLFEAMLDFEDLERLRQERRRARQSAESTLGLSDSQLTVHFDKILLHVAEGLTLTASAALVGVTRRTLAAWVRLAEDRRAPWAAWFDTLMRQDANSRRQVLRELHKLAADDPCARRDFWNQRGRPSKLEYEIEGLRRSQTAAMDALVMPSDADRNRGAGTLDATSSDEPLKGGTR